MCPNTNSNGGLRVPIGFPEASNSSTCVPSIVILTNLKTVPSFSLNFSCKSWLLPSSTNDCLGSALSVVDDSDSANAAFLVEVTAHASRVKTANIADTILQFTFFMFLPDILFFLDSMI